MNAYHHQPRAGGRRLGDHRGHALGGPVRVHHRRHDGGAR